MRFTLLGPFAFTDDAGRETTLAGPRLRVLMATLLLRANTPVSSEALAELVWDGSPPPAAVTSLRSYIRRLRQALGRAAGGRIVARDPGYLVRLADSELDVREFEALCRETATALRADAWSEASDTAARALGLWRAEPLLDVPSQALRDEVVPRLDQLRLQLMEDQIEADLGLGRHEHALPRLRDLTAQHPLREHFHAQLMLALARAGRQAEALAAYQDVRRALVGELGIEPGPELRELHERILAGDAELLRPPNAEPAPASAPEPDAHSTPRQLPAAARHFTGRHAELDRLIALLREMSTTGGSVVISAIDGMAGIGKTTLAVHAAHRLIERFPDGQLFIDLHGFTQGYEPRTPAEALDWFLRSLGVAPQRIPPDVEERAALYRQQLADSRTLIVLDNAVSEAQVRPLLPGSAGCLVLVTSRRRLKGLDDAHVLSLDILPPADAIVLLRSAAGSERVPADDPASAEIVELCGRLPLALRIAAALLRHRPVWSPDHLAALLRDQRRRVSVLSDGDRDLGVVFDLSYRNLTEPLRRLFRRLGLVPGPDFDAPAVSALVDTDPVTATGLLEDLVDHSLLIQHTAGRYRFHDLLRLHARALADGDPAAERDAALERLLDYYQHTANRADAVVSPYPRTAPDGPARTYAPDLPDAETAWAWLRTERANLLAALDAAAPARQTVALTTGLATLLLTDGPWAEAVTRYSTAATAAGRHGDRQGRADILFHLGDIRRLTGDSPGAMRDLQEALGLYRELNDRLGQATALTWLGNARLSAGDYPGAARVLREGAELYRTLDDRLGRAHALAFLGDVNAASGDCPAAIRDLEEALGLCRDSGDRSGQAGALLSLGAVRGQAGDLSGATHDLRAALDFYQDLGDRNGQGNALAHLGRVRARSHDYPAAAGHLKAALDLYRSIGARGDEAWALNPYAAAIAAMGDHAHAIGLYQDALRLSRVTHQADDEAHALEGIGECQLRAGAAESGAAHLRQALEIFRGLAMTPDADRVRARLTRLPASAP